MSLNTNQGNVSPMGNASKKAKVLTVDWHDSDITSIRIPKTLLPELDSVKVIPEEPNYKCIARLIAFYKENVGNNGH